MSENMEGMITVLIKNIKENWRLLLVGIIILAIALNSSWQSNKSSSENKKDSGTTEQPKQNGQKQQENQTQNAENGAVNAAQAKESETIQKNIIVQTAAKSEGITHLARKAVKEYLLVAKENLSPEQKIYAEDYLKKKTGSKLLKVGEKVEFSADLIKQSIEKAKGLNQKQIENLSKYVPLVKNLN